MLSGQKRLCAKLSEQPGFIAHRSPTAHIAMNTPFEFYTIRIYGHLDDTWTEWFDGLTIIYELDGTTTLHGPIRDQSALISLLIKIHNLSLTLISVNPVSAEHGLHRN